MLCVLTGIQVLFKSLEVTLLCCFLRFWDVEMALGVVCEGRVTACVV